MTLGDLYPDVRLYSEVETIIMTRGRGGSGRDIWGRGEKVGGGSGRTYGKGRGDGDGRDMIQFVAHL